MDTLAARIRMGMGFCGMRSAGDLARAVSISRQYAAKLIGGEALTDSYSLLRRMANRFGVSLMWLATGEGTPIPRESLTANESRLIDLYRRAPHILKVDVLEHLSQHVRA